jgi:hypothetical protein
MNSQKSLRLLACLAVIVIGQTSSMLHAQETCGAVFDALTKVVTTPNHSYSTRTTNGKPRTSERIYVQGKAFIRVDGKWTTIHEDTTEILQQEAENRKHGTAACQVVREESVDGQRATLYSLHSETEYATQDAQMWIAKSTGLPLREEMDTDVGAGKLGKSHLSTRYEYSNIQPPM